MPGVTQSWVWVLVRIALLAGLMSLLVIVASASPSVAVGRRHGKYRTECPSAHAHVLVADMVGVIYEAAPPKYPELPSVLACVWGHRPYELGPIGDCEGSGSEGCGGLAHEALAGPIAAYEEFNVGELSGEWFVVVRDLRSKRLLRKLPTGMRIKPVPLKVGVGHVVTIVVKSDGSVAWIAEAIEEEGTYQVHSVDKTGSRLLASGADIAPHSLALAGSTLYWTQGGKPFSAPLD